MSDEREDAAADPAPAPETPREDSPAPSGETPPAAAAASAPKLPEGLESSLPEDAPRIRIPLFEGPLDLLLYLIRRDRIDIQDLPIAPITRSYMEYIELMKQLDLDVAGEFLVMAATLIHIKSKLLVPVEPNEAEGEEDGVDPREALVQRLLELERYKQAAEVLHQKGQIRAATWTRPDGSLPSLPQPDGEELVEASLFDLISAFKELLDRRKVLFAHEVESDGRSVEQRMDEIMALLREGDSLDFVALFEAEETKGGMIVTFLALLELIRMRRIKVYQKGIFGPIRVFRPVGPDLLPPLTAAGEA